MRSLKTMRGHNKIITQSLKDKTVFQDVSIELLRTYERYFKYLQCEVILYSKNVLV